MHVSHVHHSYRNRAFWRMISSELQHRGSAPKGWRHRERKNIAKELESVRELSPPQSSGGERIVSGPGSWVDAKDPRSSYSVCFKVRRGTQKGSVLLGFVRFNSEYMKNSSNFIYFKQLDSVGLYFFFLTFNVLVLKRKYRPRKRQQLTDDRLRNGHNNQDKDVTFRESSPLLPLSVLRVPVGVCT